MKPIFPARIIGIWLYIKIFIDYLLSGMIFRKKITDDKCQLCKKDISNRRIELTIQWPQLDYEFEYCKFLCFECAIQQLLLLRRGEK